MKLFTSIICVVLAVVFGAVWLGFPPSSWGGDTTIFGILAAVFVVLGVVGWKF